MQRIVVSNGADNVATSLEALDADATVEARVDGETRAITVRDPVPFGPSV